MELRLYQFELLRTLIAFSILATVSTGAAYCCEATILPAIQTAGHRHLQARFSSNQLTHLLSDISQIATNSKLCIDPQSVAIIDQIGEGVLDKAALANAISQCKEAQHDITPEQIGQLDQSSKQALSELAEFTSRIEQLLQNNQLTSSDAGYAYYKDVFQFASTTVREIDTGVKAQGLNGDIKEHVATLIQLIDEERTKSHNLSYDGILARARIHDSGEAFGLIGRTGHLDAIATILPELNGEHDRIPHTPARVVSETTVVWGQVYKYGTVPTGGTTQVSPYRVYWEPSKLYLEDKGTNFAHLLGGQVSPDAKAPLLNYITIVMWAVSADQPNGPHVGLTSDLLVTPSDSFIIQLFVP